MNNHIVTRGRDFEVLQEPVRWAVKTKRGFVKLPDGWGDASFVQSSEEATLFDFLSCKTYCDILNKQPTFYLYG